MSGCTCECGRVYTSTCGWMSGRPVSVGVYIRTSTCGWMSGRPVSVGVYIPTSTCG